VATNKELRENGIEVIELEGNELSKVLGGPRCAVMEGGNLDWEKYYSAWNRKLLAELKPSLGE